MSLPRSLGTFPWFIKSGDKNYCHIPAKSFENLPKCPYISSIFSRDVAHKRPDYYFYFSGHTSAIYLGHHAVHAHLKHHLTLKVPLSRSLPCPRLCQVCMGPSYPQHSTQRLQDRAGCNTLLEMNHLPTCLVEQLRDTKEHAGELEKGGG